MPHDFVRQHLESDVDSDEYSDDSDGCYSDDDVESVLENLPKEFSAHLSFFDRDNIIWLSRNYSYLQGRVGKAGTRKIQRKDEIKKIQDVLGLGEPTWHLALPYPYMRAPDYYTGP